MELKSLLQQFDMRTSLFCGANHAELHKWSRLANDPFMVVRADPHPIDLHIGGQIRQRRMQLGMTLAELGRKVGVVNQQVHRHEKWGHRLYPLQILKYAAALDVSVPYFFEGAPSKTVGLVRRGDARYAGAAPKLAKESVFDRSETRRLLEVFSTILESKQRRMVIQLVKRMASAEPKPTRSVKGSATIGGRKGSR